MKRQLINSSATTGIAPSALRPSSVRVVRLHGVQLHGLWDITAKMGFPNFDRTGNAPGFVDSPTESAAKIEARYNLQQFGPRDEFDALSPKRQDEYLIQRAQGKTVAEALKIAQSLTGLGGRKN